MAMGLIRDPFDLDGAVATEWVTTDPMRRIAAYDDRVRDARSMIVGGWWWAMIRFEDLARTDGPVREAFERLTVEAILPAVFLRMPGHDGPGR